MDWEGLRGFCLFYRSQRNEPEFLTAKHAKYAKNGIRNLFAYFAWFAVQKAEFCLTRWRWRGGFLCLRRDRIWTLCLQWEVSAAAEALVNCKYMRKRGSGTGRPSHKRWLQDVSRGNVLVVSGKTPARTPGFNRQRHNDLH